MEVDCELFSNLLSVACPLRIGYQSYNVRVIPASPVQATRSFHKHRGIGFWRGISIKITKIATAMEILRKVWEDIAGGKESARPVRRIMTGFTL